MARKCNEKPEYLCKLCSAKSIGINAARKHMIIEHGYDPVDVD